MMQFKYIIYHLPVVSYQRGVSQRISGVSTNASADVPLPSQLYLGDIYLSALCNLLFCVLNLPLIFLIKDELSKHADLPGSQY